MIEEFAVVTKRLDGYVMLEVERRTACGLCGQKRGCGNATWGKLLGHQSQAFVAENTIDAKLGESVVVGIDEREILSTVFYLYVVPLISMFVAAVAADQLFNNELYVILAAALGLLLGFLWVKGHLVGYGAAKKSLGHQCRATVLRHADETQACQNTLQHE
ncbi:MAG: Fis family transcriptional regulator [Methylotenera sp. 24-45-7]|jgi:sigma-E factor negative regulatory protein RseC|nr:MAG: Fis family transcriptional regulator [Methylophilales bacterium 16-45-9]OYZ41096.1 MAG: Fis family transcriptional regulator [Methylotenera sp. 24-45-7]OZA09620.1 MAG: Fis family transcriptional regulator [Methylotenera sp. 17-45-7]HQS43563.1 SoxR reducing system RseC family protein [Methylotenera sp.]